jgi:RHS repeat-associated protein
MAVDDKYVMNGVWLTCDKGVTPSRFNVTPKPVQLYDEHFANELDKIALVNILPFGACSVKYGSPCLPVPVLWERVMEDGLTVLGARPLLDTSKCQCAIGGQIAIHFTKAGASAAVALDQKLDKVDEVADLAEKASGWAFWGGIGLAVGGAILCATGVGAPLGAAMIVGGGELIEASTILASAAAVVKGVTKFARDPSKEAGLSIVGEVATNLALNFIMNKLGGVVVKQLGKWAQKAMNKLGLSERASKLANRLLCTVTGHPVDVISGYLYTETVDFEFPGPLPLRWERLWNSTSVHAGPLGHGWHHSYDLALVVEETEGYAALRGADGRGIAFDVPALGDSAFNRLEKMSLLRDAHGYGVRDHSQGLTYHFGPARPDGVRALATVENANGFAITFTYDAHGHLVQIVDSAKRQFAVQCDEAGRILTISTAHPTEPRQRVTLVTYSYNSRGELMSAADALEQVAAYQYQGKLLVRETLKNGLSFYFEYQGWGPEARCVHTWGDEGIYDHHLVYDLGNRRTVVTNSLGYATTYLGNENGLVMQVQDARGGVTRTEYNEYNELRKETNPLGHTSTYTYDERGNPAVIASATGAITQLTFDKHDRCVKAIDTIGSTWQWVYDAAGNLITRTDALGNSIAYQYTEGLLRYYTDARQHSTEFCYDESGNLREERALESSAKFWLYDGWGRPCKLTNQQGGVQWREYDLLCRLTRVYEPDGNVCAFTYNALDKITQIKDRQRNITLFYKGLGRLVRRVEAGVAVEFMHDTEEQLRAVMNEHGLIHRFMLDGKGSVTTETGYDGLMYKYERDLSGRMIEVVRPTGKRTKYTYDPAGRITAINYSDGNQATYAYRLDGALLEATNKSAIVRFERNVLGSILEEKQGNITVTNTYDKLGQRVALTSSLGGNIEYQYDGWGAIAQMSSGQWQQVVERDSAGLVVQRTMSGGVSTRWRRDQTGRPTEQRIAVGVGQISRQRSYTWAPEDWLNQIEDSHNGSTTFQHNIQGSLVATLYNNGTQELRQPDEVGNLFRTAQRQDRRYGAAGQLLETRQACYSYDAAGNLCKKVTKNGQEWQYSWNEAGQLVAVVRPDGQLVHFTYDALSRRLSKQVAGKTTHWIWDDNVPLHEWMEDEHLAESDVTTWLFEEGFTPVGKLAGAAHYSIVADHLDTPLQMHNHRGEVVWSAELDSYGRIREASATVNELPFRFQGQYEDVETGLYYNRFRYYDPESGQYISQDPIGLLGNNTTSYAYVPDPTKLIDPLGLYNGDGSDGSPRRALNDYKALHSHRLDPTEYTNTDKYHFAKANEALHNRIKADPQFGQALETQYPGINKHVSPTKNNTFRGTAPKNVTWHHATEAQVGGQKGWLQLVDRNDHKTFHKIYHPDDIGGRNEWGGGTACRK